MLLEVRTQYQASTKLSRCVGAQCTDRHFHSLFKLRPFHYARLPFSIEFPPTGHKHMVKLVHVIHCVWPESGRPVPSGRQSQTTARCELKSAITGQNTVPEAPLEELSHIHTHTNNTNTSLYTGVLWRHSSTLTWQTEGARRFRCAHSKPAKPPVGPHHFTTLPHSVEENGIDLYAHAHAHTCTTYNPCNMFAWMVSCRF